MPEPDDGFVDVPEPAPGDISGDEEMAELGENSFLHWKEQLYNQRASAGEGHQFFTEALRSAHLEGKVGMRESVAMRNIPPVARDASNPPG